jgi:hypothetical protein
VNDDYLWDKTGHDREVEALEELLEPLRQGARGAEERPRGASASAPLPLCASEPVVPCAGASASVPLRDDARELEPAARRSRLVWIPALATLATAAAVVAAVRWWTPGTEPAGATEPGTTAAREIDLKQYGTVDVHPGAVLEVVRQTDDDIRLRLERGTIEARITLAARPRLFQVETPATICVDLGCRYTLTVEPDGSTFVHVDAGEVAFEGGGRETWIPSAASCRAWRSRGSGTPRWDDAPPALAAAIDALDRSDPSGRRAAAEQVIALCDAPRDALSLWHLAHDLDPGIAEAAWSALVDLVGVPEGVLDPRAASAAETWKLHLESVW